MGMLMRGFAVPGETMKDTDLDEAERCVHCHLLIFGAMRGAGDGRGQKFAHEDCYWRAEAGRLEKALAECRGRLDRIYVELTKDSIAIG